MKLVRGAVAHKFQLKVSTCNSGFMQSQVIVLGGVYMAPGRLSPRGEFTPFASHGSIFVYMIPPQNVMPARVTAA